jgi:type I restriction enzyme R subunit
MTPEEKARVKIDKMLESSGWRVVSRDEFVPNEAIAVKEGLMQGNKEADYLLFLMGKAVGILEAKREEIDVNTPDVINQAENYTHILPSWCQWWQKPLPFVWLSNGKDYYFRDIRKEDAEYQKVDKIFTPKEVVKILGIQEKYAGLPMLQRRGLRDCQFEGITELEKSLKEGKRRALMVLATGAGKTYLAITAAYRLLNYANYHRVLFLVDRNNLGRQAEREFGSYRLTESGDPFNTIYGVERLKSHDIPKDANVVISTIQRLFSYLNGEDFTDEDDDDEITLYENDDDTTRTVPLPEHPNLPRDYFDLIIIDECHRSIYSGWRSVLDYFDSAVKIGLTATPAPQTLAYFEQNRVVNYTLEKSIADHVNVGCRTYRIKTEQTEHGGAILEGQNVKQETVYTGETQNIVSDTEVQYGSEELNRSIINPAQIKLILQTYKDAVYSEMFTDPQREPNFDYLPKTLIFALNERHAENIVKIANEVFGRTSGDGFVQKITYRSGNTDQLIKDFCNERKFRIAVTVTLVATGIDIKPLEVVMFMRYVQSALLYVQMKGRGVRTIGDDVLRSVTPNAFSKDLFYLVDAVGVTEREHTIPQPTGPTPPPYPSLEELLERIAHGDVNDDYLNILASRLSRIDAKAKDAERDKFVSLAGVQIRAIAMRIFDALNPETQPLPPFVNINEVNAERKALVAELTASPVARKYLCELNAGYVKTLIPGEDNLISKGFTLEEAQQAVDAFEEYVTTHRDDMEILQLIYSGKPVNRTMLEELSRTLQDVNAQFEPHRLWNSYALVQPEKVKHFKSEEREQRNLLTNLIQLVRYAYRQIEKLDTLYITANQYFNLWCGQVQRELTEDQKQIFAHIKDYIVANGSCTIEEYRSVDEPNAARLILSMGGMAKVRESLLTLSQFIIYQKAA